MALANSIQQGNRISYLDALRGIAIFFILVANIVSFSGYLFEVESKGINEIKLATDVPLDYLLYTLVDGKFYSIFSLLFGIGFVIQQRNLSNRNELFTSFFVRRMVVLLFIGSIHLVFIWFGDILTLYALMGLFLLFFKDLGDKSLISLAVIFLALPILNWMFMKLTGWSYPDFFFDLKNDYWSSMGFPLVDYGTGVLGPDLALYVTTQNTTDFFYMTVVNSLDRIGWVLKEGRAFKVLGIFLLGIFIGRRILSGTFFKNENQLRKIFVWGVIIGLPVSAFRTYIEFYQWGNESWDPIKHVSYFIGTVPLALGYVAGIALIWLKKPTSLSWFQPVGRMALSNYISQSIIGIALFYGVGFGLAGKLGFTLMFVAAILIFTFQIVISSWWLRHFQYGPLEWIWRRLSYGAKLQQER